MKCWKLISLLVLLLFAFACKKNTPQPHEDTYIPMSVGNFSDNWTCSINPGVGANFDIGEFRLWVPDLATASNLKAILVLTDRLNNNALNMANDTVWRNYAIANNVALLSVHLENQTLPTSYPYYDANNGSGQALLMALDAIATKNNISKVADLPFLLRGYSSGGIFSYYFSAYKPERVVAFANIRGWYIFETSAENKGIPALFLVGENDTVDYVPVDNMQQLVIKKRYSDGLWAYAIEKAASHYSSVLRSDSLVRQFFSSALSKRITAGSTALIAVPQTSGWLGDNVSKSAVLYTDYTGNKKEASWLPDENTATAWTAYQKK